MGKLAKALLKEAEKVKRVSDKLALCYRNTLIDVGESLAFFTPIDTGLASSNWNVTNGPRVSTAREPKGGKKGAASIEAIKDQVNTIKIGDRAIFHNPVDYIGDLDNGYSRQAPAGMITPTKPRVKKFWIANLQKFDLLGD